ncbi:MAG: primosomal protein N' [Eubacteriales bacterium]|nr:primosomal protein N' [Eubacteriales bacterium]
MSRFANVIVDISHEKVDRPFQYKVPPGLAAKVVVGSRVEISFGRGSQLRTGYVIELTDEAEFPEARMKEIEGVIDGGQEPEQKMIALAAWMKEQYGSTMIQALKTVLPARRKVALKEKKEIGRLLSEEEIKAARAECERKHQTAKARLLAELEKEEILPWELVTKKLNISSQTVKSLEAAGMIRLTTISCYRNPVKMTVGQEEGKRLSAGQRSVVETVLADFDAGSRRPYLIHGITGSGKTEVYLSLIEGIIERGRQAIVLIPEIALTYQTVLRFYKRFGDRVSVMNSSLSAGEKQDQCERARKGEIDVIIGPRSALFVPFAKLGMIVIDEEHENSYKSETMPKYHTRETALKLAQLSDAVVVMGSATPSLEAYSRAQSGEFGLFKLGERLTGGELPQVYVEDLRRELKEGNRSIFSRRLQEKIEDRLNRKEQTMLFLNRRGYAGFVSCRSCGYVCKCPHCEVSLSEHKNGRLICHYCGYEQPAVKLCPQCGSRYILGFRAGTEAIEEQLLKMYPQARVLRMDADTTRTKDSYEKILASFSNQEADILVGTQMIVKGHDFPEVTLVGILAADLSLAVNDYRAGERTFQLLTQAAGRAGRGQKAGEVVIQTYQPEHYSIRYAAAQDYEGFYEEEMTYRRLLSYPPTAHILAVQISAEKEEDAVFAAREAAQAANPHETGLTVIGPAPAQIGRINDIYRYGVYIKAKDYQKLVAVKDRIEKLRAGQDRPKGTCQFDFDPMNAY